MSQNVIYVGIDVDDVHYYGCAVDQHTGEALDFQCRPTLKRLVRQLEKVRGHLGRVHLKLCYEASHVGFSLQRDLRMQGYDYEVVAPTSMAGRADAPVGGSRRFPRPADEGKTSPSAAEGCSELSNRH